MLISPSHQITPTELLRQIPDRLVFACDFYLEGIERGLEVPGGYRWGDIINVDHHAPTSRMMRLVSSTNLAIQRVREMGPAPDDAAVVINHTDCDSVLSSLVIAGEQPPEEQFGEAAIAADHTGKENEIADLLQSLEEDRNLDLARHSLLRLLSGERLPEEAAAKVEGRRRRRAEAAELVRRGGFKRIGAVWLALPTEHVEGELFQPLLPDAVVIMLATRLKDDPSRWQIKLRLGPAAPAGMTLHDVMRGGVDPAYAGRWNAGSNKRGGGTAMEPEAYAARVDRKVTEVLASA